MEHPVPEESKENTGLSRQAKLAQRLRQGGAGRRPGRRPAGEAPQLSISQERLWFLSQLEPESPAYNRPLAARMRGEVDAGRLRRALNEVVARHEVLRSAYPAVEGVPRVAVEAVVDVTLAVLNCPEGEDDGEIWAREMATRLNREPFDLASAPLMRCSFLQLNNGGVLVVIFHHIIFDGWSAQVFLADLAEAYRQAEGDGAASLPELSLQYFDYAAWWRVNLGEDVFERQLNYWRNQLRDAAPGLNLPTDYQRPAKPDGKGAVARRLLAVHIAGLATQMSRLQNATLFMTLLAAFQALLFRYSGQNDILIGTPVAGRTHAESEKLIGFFVNTLVIRSTIDREMSFEQLLAQVRKTCLEAFGNQDIPFERLVQEVQAERDLSKSPLFQVMFQLRNVPKQAVRLGSAVVEGFVFESGQAKYDLVVELEETPAGLALAIEYRTDLFAHETIERMTGHYETLLEGAANNPRGAIGDLPLLTEKELRQLEEWNETGFDFPREARLHDAFEAQAALHPEATALVFEGEQLSYGELNRQANRLACSLIQRGVRANSRVGVCIERSFEMVTALLGVLKAGGCYVPLDAEYPEERLTAMAEIAGLDWLLTTRANLAKVERLPGRVMCLDEAAEREELERRPGTNPPPTSRATDLAYVIFTSGSTGKPKGVMITHRGVCSRIYYYQAWKFLAPGEGYLHKAPLGFDPSVRELFWPLSFGGRVVMAKPGGHLDNGYLVELIAAQGVSRMNFVPSLLELFLDEPGLARCSCLRHVLSSGERLSSELRDRFFARMAAELHNFYGPTETSLTATVWTCNREKPERVIPVGRPVGNTQIWVLDEDLQMLPVGVPGEICLAGVGLSPGYINQDELTAEKFIPYQEAFGERIYRTGDLGRYLPDGSLDYLGRIDQQVKINGVRVELGEIEAVMLEEPGVNQACAVLRVDEAGRTRLTGYLTEKEKMTVDLEALTQRLKRKLPAAMVPGVFIQMRAFPVSPNGKIDRKALPAPDFSHNQSELDEAATGEIEIELARLWSKVLGVQQVPRNRTFFELGGYSLLAVRLFAEIRRVFGRKLPLGTIFTAPTVASLAEVIRGEGWQSPWRALVPIRAGGSVQPLFCVHAAGGGVFDYQALPQFLPEDQPVYGLQETGNEVVDGPLSRVEAMAEAYLEEVVRFQPEGPYRLAGYSFGGLVAYEIACQLLEQGKAVDVVVLFDTHTPQLNKVRRAATPVQRAQFHLRRLRERSMVDKVKYIATALRTLWGRAMVRARLKQVRTENEPVERPEAATDLLYLYRLVAERYQPRPFAGRLVLLRAMDAQDGAADDRSLGWSELVKGSFSVVDVPGDHFTILREPNLPAAGKALAEALRQLRA